MACVISAPSSGSGKTILSLILASWARQNSLSIQTFKIGPDYLDPQQLEAVSGRPCRNLDLILTNLAWVKDTYYGYGGSTDLTLIEGVMGLFDGVGSSTKASTAEIAKILGLPIVLVVDAKGQAASLAALVKGFRDEDPSLKLAGVVLNNVTTERHKKLLIDVLKSNRIEVLGTIPSSAELKLCERHLGLAPAHEIKNIRKKINQWASICSSHLDINKFNVLLKSPKYSEPPIKKFISSNNLKSTSNNCSIAIAQDHAFHFRYPEMKEYLEALGLNVYKWSPLNNERIPKQARGLIIPGGFPEQYAKEISECKESLLSLKNYFGKHPIYTECGGMLLFGKTLTDLKGEKFPMLGILPFNAQQGKLEVGYRRLKSQNRSLILDKNQVLFGHEFHRWRLEFINDQSENNLTPIWKMSGWAIKEKKEGWSNKMFHASWIHLHWPSNSSILNNWNLAIKNETIQPEKINSI